jgi:cytochrome b involved in lipid metabolism
MVLDVSRFMEEHPGGKFSLEHNIGRDISKFFYGAYQLENLPTGCLKQSL